MKNRSVYATRRSKEKTSIVKSNFRRNIPYAFERLEERVVFNTYWVTNLADDGIGSLRAAIVSANTHAGDDTVSFKSNVAGTIALTHELEVSGNTEIDGNRKVSVSGQDSTRVLKIDAGAKVEISKLTITHGKTSDALGGAGILNLGELKLKQSIVTGNTAVGTAGVFPAPNVGGNGGGINSFGKLAIEDSEVTNNKATFFGGGIENTGTATIEDSKVTKNDAGKAGGGIRNSKISTVVASTGDLKIEESLIADNTTVGDGAGIRNERATTLTIEKSIISGNVASGFGTGGLASGGALTIRESLITRNRSAAAGIYLMPSTSSALISHSEIYYNTPSSPRSVAGGILDYSYSETVVEDSLIRNNEGNFVGGIFSPSSSLKIVRSTVSNNVGGFAGGIVGDGADLLQTTVDGNSGGLVGGIAGGTRIDSSTISNNKATPKGSFFGVGGIAATPNYDLMSHLKLINSTISGNIVDAKDLSTTVDPYGAMPSAAGGIRVVGDRYDASVVPTIENTTIAFNKIINAPDKSRALSTGGVLGFGYSYPGYGQIDANIKTRNTIIARNEVNTKPDDVAGTFVSSGHNLIGVLTSDATGFIASDLKGTQAAPLDPKLGALAYNGGYTKTHLPQNNSPARDAGDSSGATATDQRGHARIAGASIDIGAVESRSRRIGDEIEDHDHFFMFGDFDEEDWFKKIASHFDTPR